MVNEKEIKYKIKNEFKIREKIKELEKILRRPCEINIIIQDVGKFTFFRFLDRGFNLIPVKDIKEIKELAGEYNSINDLLKKAKEVGFKTKKHFDSSCEISFKGRTYHIIAHGIFLERLRAGVLGFMYKDLLAKIKFKKIT